MFEKQATLISIDLASLDDRRESLVQDIINLSDGRFWNYIPGAFFIRTDKSKDEIGAVLDVYETNYIIMPVIGEAISGRVPEEGWDSWFFNLHSDRATAVSEAQGWDYDSYIKVVEKHFEDKKVVNAKED